MKLILVMIGGFFGAIARYGLGEWIHHDSSFPFSTLFINLGGCFCLGWFLTYVRQTKKIRPHVTLFVGTGFLGSFTTFSTFSIEVLQLLQVGLVFSALLYVLFSTFGGLSLAFLGYRMAITNKKTGGA